jgi:tetratricopeptide (TPR) repeat protein
MNKPGRNDPCHCGSGKKYKQCCLGKDEAAATSVRTIGDQSAQLLQAAIAHHQAGRLNEAEPLYRQILKDDPKHADALNLLGVLAHQTSHHDAAVELIGKALAERPSMAIYHNNMGLVLAARGDAETALEHYNTALAIQPEFAEAHNNAGNLHREQGRHTEASEHYRQALRLNPSYAEAHYNLGIVLQDQGQLADAIREYRAAIALKPDYFKAWNNLGNLLVDEGDVAGSQDCYQKALAINPNYATTYVNLSALMLTRGDGRQAADYLQRALAIDPKDADAHSHMAAALQAIGKLEQAIVHGRQAVALAPEDAGHHNNLASALQGHGEWREAQAEYERAIALKPDLADAHAGLAALHVDLGDFDAARTEVERALAAQPNHAAAWATIPSLRKMTTDDGDWLAQAQALLARDNPPIATRGAIRLNFALGKYYDDTRQYDQAFAAYHQGNRLKRRTEGPFDRAGYSQFVDTVIRVYTAEFVNREWKGASPSELPVMIGGMPRSGTSLTEQIIASHPQAFGAGELFYWSQQSTRFKPAIHSGQIPPALITTFASGYEGHLRTFSPEALRIVDKMPNNFQWFGLFHLVFPHGRIIHTRRNPIDTCLSIYFQNFSTGYSYGTDLDDLAFYYREYLRLMDHWREVLPADRLLEIDYEELVDDQEGGSRRIIEFLGLPWNDRCLDFHKTERKVGTASNWQVRQKIYKTSKERWRNYEQHVGPLAALLETETVS